MLTGKYAATAEERARQPGRLTTTGWGKGFLTERHLALACGEPDIADWTYDPRMWSQVDPALAPNPDA